MMRIAKVGYWEKDLKNNRWIWSAETYEIYGIKTGSLITDEVIRSALSAGEREKRDRRIEKLLKGPAGISSFKFEYPIFPGTLRQKWIAGEAFLEQDRPGAQARFFGWVQDISERKKIEEELRRAKEKAEESERLKSNFLANMSHEIRTPLNAILGFSDLLTRTDSADEQEKFKSIINKSSTLLLKIIDDILDFSSIESGSLDLVIEAVSVRALFTDIKQIFSSHRNENINLSIILPPEGITVSADRERLKQVMINLVNNALKYTREGSIDVGCLRENHDHNITFFVRDTGIGIEADKVDSIFERFYQANSFSKGTGLGLTITKSIIEQMGGSIKVESKPNEGSEFSFYLPSA